MKQLHIKKFRYISAVIVGSVSLIALPVSALTTAGTTTTTPAATSTSTTSNTKSSTEAANQQARLELIISRGNVEINRRLATLSTLGSKITSATKLSSSDAATLSNTVSSDTSSLTTLQTKLDADTTADTAATDAQSIILDYRVYALVVPQVDLVKTADDQQVTEGKLATLSTKLASRITADQQAGKNVTALQASLSDLNTKVSAAQAISSNIETTVIALVPSDYNSNHEVLSGDRSQLQTAQTDIKAAVSDAQSIITGLKSL
jgi:hypothetical protein